MEWLFGKQKTPREMLREHKRSIDRAIRELERERNGLQRQEQKIIMEIKKTAKAGEMDAVKIMARDLVRTRKHVQKFYKMKVQLQAVSMKIVTLKSNAAMAEVMQGVTKTMKLMNRKLNAPAIQRILMDFERQNEMMDMKEGVLDDAIDEAMDDEMDEEEETDQIVNQVLDEIGIDLSGQLTSAPSPDQAAETAPSKGKQAVGIADGPTSQKAKSSTSKKPLNPDQKDDGRIPSPAPPPPSVPDGSEDVDLLARLDALKQPK